MIVHSFCFIQMRRFTHYILLLAILFPVLLASCSDEDSFTTDRNAVVTFSQDVVSFDTVFAGISSSTEKLLVYNRNDKGVRIKNAKLLSEGTSGFKMNVDGQYGTSIDDVDVLGNDSIFIFLEVNAPQQETNAPTLFSDAIVFTLESGVQQSVTLEAYGQNVKIFNALCIENDCSLDNSIPYLIRDSLVVKEGATLTLDEGATLYFHNGANLFVHGSLSIRGTLEHPVTLRGDRLDRMFSYLPYDRLDNQWGGIYLNPSCGGCDINYADIHSGNFGIEGYAVAGDITIQNSVIHNVSGDGLCLVDCNALVANTQISNSKGDCVSIYGGKADFYYCTIAQFYPWSGDRGNALFASNYIDEEEHLIEAANFYNCFVTGYANDEVYGYPGEQPLNINFYHCVLLTDTSDPTYFHDCTSESKDFERYKDSNFKLIDTENYIYDFHLDELSTARQKGSAIYSSLYPIDRDGTLRPDMPDAGCYQSK